jgi:methyl coenzyme M reductase alpha subunit
VADKTINEIEMQLTSALAEDIEATIGEEVTVLNHVTVAEVMLNDGTTRTVWSATEGLAEYALLGLIAWLDQQAKRT